MMNCRVFFAIFCMFSFLTSESFNDPTGRISSTTKGLPISFKTAARYSALLITPVDHTSEGTLANSKRDVLEVLLKFADLNNVEPNVIASERAAIFK